MTEFCVVDVETSGLSPEKDKIVEIAVAWRRNGIIHSASEFINPGVPIPPEVSGITHIVDDDVKDARTVDQVVNPATFPKGILVAHNAAFDSKFLPQLVDRQWLCTMQLSKHLYPDAPNYKNQTMRYYLGLKPDVPKDLAPHRALYDTLVTLAIVEHMLKDHSMQELLDLQKRPVLLKTVTFGKYKGTLWSTVPRDYCQWLLRQDPSGGIGDDQRYTARHWIQHG